MRCPQCGNVLAGPVAFCPACGAPQASRPPPSAPPPVLDTTPAPSGSALGLRYQIVGGNAFASARVELAPEQS
ncbi:MAG TPA: hypothetical protein VD838_11990, partial [Anaeromyxobacteraceae bacterium]|nr:hypothetical protein [Anaeromyxobacteraceae bacterium]